MGWQPQAERSGEGRLRLVADRRGRSRGVAAWEYGRHAAQGERALPFQSETTTIDIDLDMVEVGVALQHIASLCRRLHEEQPTCHELPWQADHRAQHPLDSRFSRIASGKRGCSRRCCRQGHRVEGRSHASAATA